MTNETIIEWEKEFDEFVKKNKGASYEIIKDFIKEQLTLAERKGKEKAKKEIVQKLEDASWTTNGHTVVCMSDVWNIALKQSQDKEGK